jgi:Holliday junction DNA helicase RuvA
MFAYLKGLLSYKDPTTAIVDVSGVGYQVNIPLSTYEALPHLNERVKLLIYYHVREDTQMLFGFASQEEKDLFLMLIGVSGIGPKMALGILSGTTPVQFRERIISGDLKALTLIPGIGIKTAKRIMIELRERLVGVDEEFPEEVGGTTQISDEALKALLSLGYRRYEALKALRKAYKELGDGEPVEKYIKAAISKM